MSDLKADLTLDNSGLSCPMPIIKTKKAMDGMKVGEILKMVATDPGSVSDIQAWVKKTGQELLGQETEGKSLFFTFAKQNERRSPCLKKALSDWRSFRPTGLWTWPTRHLFYRRPPWPWTWKQLSFYLFWSGNSEKGQNRQIKSLARSQSSHADEIPNIIAMLPGMTPIATIMMNSWMRKAKVPRLSELLATAQEMGVRLIGCQMTMDVMGIKKEDLIDGIEIGGAATFLEFASQNAVTLSF